MKTCMHFTDPYLLNPTNPVTVNLIGAGGTGHAMLTALAKMNQALQALGHPGMFVRIFDDDRVSDANRGRQLFAASEVGYYKAAVLVNRVNRFFGTDWKAVTDKFSADRNGHFEHLHAANLYISCVDTISARFGIAEAIREISSNGSIRRDKPLYWLDCGNGKDYGQAVLATVGEIKQPPSQKFDATGSLPFVTEEFRALLENADEISTPSCSLAEALEKQELFINPAIADLSACLLWRLLRQAMTPIRGFFLNLDTMVSQPIPVSPSGMALAA